MQLSDTTWKQETCMQIPSFLWVTYDASFKWI